jgi:ribosomal protein L11 methyltransferase
VVRICGLFPGTINRDEVALALLHVAGSGLPDPPAWREVVDQVWERAWMDRFQPMRFGRKLWIVPSGMEPPDDAQAVLLRLDPGLAFGTGTHPSTALCLRWIDEREFAGSTVVDYGCGSGILGIACAMKGAQRVICVDNDLQALEATAANAERNAVRRQIVCRTPETYKENNADVLLANILAGPLVGLAPRLLGSLRQGGQIVLSGILEEQAENVARIYRKSCGELEAQVQQGWVRLDGFTL